MKRTLILADNQDITRRGMQALAVTECVSLFSTVTEADSRSELTRALLADPEAVAVIDYTLFDCTESQLTALKERFPRAPFILFCDSLNQKLTRRLVFSQALFCMLPKDSSLKEIRECLTEATEGRPYLTGKVAAWLKQSGKTTDAVSPLTTTEKKYSGPWHWEKHQGYCLRTLPEYIYRHDSPQNISGNWVSTTPTKPSVMHSARALSTLWNITSELRFPYQRG